MQMMRRAVLLGAVALVLVSTAASPASGAPRIERPSHLGFVKHFVVIYQENHSFDNLYGLWEGVNGLATADPAHTTQVKQDGAPYSCLLQDDVNLAAAAPQDCNDSANGVSFSSHFVNALFAIDQYIAPSATTCPPSPAVAFTQPNGWLDGTGSPRRMHPRHRARLLRAAVPDQRRPHEPVRHGKRRCGARHGSLRHEEAADLPLPPRRLAPALRHPRQLLPRRVRRVVPQPPVAGGRRDSDRAGHQPFGARRERDARAPLTAREPESGPALRVRARDRRRSGGCRRLPGPARARMRQLCDRHEPVAVAAARQRFHDPAADPPDDRRPAERRRHRWAWYSGGWSNAAGLVGEPGYTNGNGTSCTDPNSFPNPAPPYCPHHLFQFHHQPFNYFANYAEGAPGRPHLGDEAEFIDLVAASGKRCQLLPVSFVKPIGGENEHPGYSSEPIGSDHLVELLRAIEGSRCRQDTMVIVTYDEFGHQWDHVPPPGQLGGPTRLQTSGSGNAGSDARDHAPSPWQLRRRPHAVRHDVDPGDAREPLRPGTADDARAGVNDLSSVFKAKHCRGRPDPRSPAARTAEPCPSRDTVGIRSPKSPVCLLVEHPV